MKNTLKGVFFLISQFHNLRGRSLNQIFLVLLALFIFNSCDVQDTYSSVPYGKIITDGVEIAAEDGFFTLRSDEIWTPPIQNETAKYGMYDPGADMVNFYKTALLYMGAKKVRVKVPYQSRPLYGVLVLSKIYYLNSGNPVVTRSYQISIPKNYVDAAQNGKVSVLYESYEVPNSEFMPKTWVLWLSDIPFSTDGYKSNDATGLFNTIKYLL